jgi:hypothetical protein
MSFKLMDRLLVICSEGIVRGRISRTYLGDAGIVYVILSDFGTFHITSKGMLTSVVTDCNNE